MTGTQLFQACQAAEPETPWQLLQGGDNPLVRATVDGMVISVTVNGDLTQATVSRRVEVPSNIGAGFVYICGVGRNESVGEALEQADQQYIDSENHLRVVCGW